MPFAIEFAELIYDFGLFNNVDLFVLGLRRRVLLSIDLAIAGRDLPSIFCYGNCIRLTKMGEK